MQGDRLAVGSPILRAADTSGTLEIHCGNCGARFVAFYGTEEDAATEIVADDGPKTIPIPPSPRRAVDKRAHAPSRTRAIGIPRIGEARDARLSAYLNTEDHPA